MSLKDLLAHIENDQKDLMAELNTPKANLLKDVVPLASY